MHALAVHPAVPPIGAGHMRPQELQLFESEVVSTQAPPPVVAEAPQSVCPDVLHRQVPPMQVDPVGHT